jgi:hypothetical protein
MRWEGHVACIVEMRNAYRILVRKPEKKILFGRHRHRQEDNIKMDLREMGYEGVDWIHLAQDRDQWWGSCEHDNEPSGSILSEQFLV